MRGANVKAVGKRGSWFATVDGERLACVHAFWVKRDLYSDPGYQPDDPLWIELLESIRATGKVVLTSDAAKDAPGNKSGKAFDRTGYIAVFAVADLEADEAGLKFRLASRLRELK